MQMIWRCPSCVPRYRVVRPDGRKLGWAVISEYVGYLVPDRHLEVKKPPKACPECRTPLVRANGQTLVEFALVLPIFLLLMLGFGELAFLFSAQHGYQNGADVLAQWAAEEMASSPGESWQSSWNAVVKDEANRTGCGNSTILVTFPDETHLPGDRVRVAWDCSYFTKLPSSFGTVLPVRVESEAVVPGTLMPTPTSTP